MSACQCALRSEWEAQRREIFDLKNQLKHSEDARANERQNHAKQQADAMAQHAQENQQRDRQMECMRNELCQLIGGAKKKLEEMECLQQCGCVLPPAEYKKNDFRKWLKDAVQLPQYLNLFIGQGFDCLDGVQRLTDCDLQEMGICKKGHRNKILVYINGLKN